jgi:hypothetical protein
MLWVPGWMKRKKSLVHVTCLRLKNCPKLLCPKPMPISWSRKLNPCASIIRFGPRRTTRYSLPQHRHPCIIREIGRLREITFREVGEGTNKATDLDEYDIYYHHLFIWDTEAKMIVGAYRIGLGDEIFYSVGKKGFYINELFKLKRAVYPGIKEKPGAWPFMDP